MVSDSTLQVTFEKLPLADFGCNFQGIFRLSENIKIPSPFQLHILVKSDVLHMLQPKQHIMTD